MGIVTSRTVHACSLSIALLVVVVPASGQIPDEFTNLKVLPEDTGKRELMDVMRAFSGALGVRCSHCHVEKEPDSLRGMDFATDELEHKKVARAMMKMTREINGKLLPTIGRKSPMRVRCVTCHRGLEEPESIDTVLSSVASKQGVPAAIDRYEELREEYYGRGSYDFGPGTLNELAEERAQQDSDLDGAVQLVKLNLEHHPDDATSHLMLGQLLSAKGDKAAAIASVEKALELEPDNRWGQQLLERLREAE